VVDGDLDADQDLDSGSDVENPDAETDDEPELDDVIPHSDGDLDDESFDRDSESSEQSEAEESEEESLPFDCHNDQFNNENIDEANAVELLPPISAQGLGICSWEEDWFAVDLEQNQGIRATILFNTRAGIMDIKLYREGHNGLTDFLALAQQIDGGMELVYNFVSDGKHFIRVHGRGQEMAYDLHISTSESGFGEGNDLCTMATAIGVGDSVTGTTTSRHHDDDASCSESLGADVVYRLSIIERRNVIITLSAGFDSVLYVRQDCFDRASELGCADEHASGLQEVLTFDSMEPGEYLIFIDGRRWEDFGTFQIQIR
jgi:hypothetical protein